MANSSNLAFCLEYSNHKTDMMEAFDDYLRNESMVDVMLSCEGNTIKAHKMVLSAGSTYFRNIFAAFKNPFQFPVLIIKDMPFCDLKAIVEFLYRGEVVVPVEQVSSLSKSAQTLFIKGLEKYFNKSAVVDVSNPSTNSSDKTNNNLRATQPLQPIPLSAHKSKPKQSFNDSKRSIGMSLRKTRRPDYRQLSNGDFISEEEVSDNDDNHSNERKKTFSGHSGHVSHISRKIKSEMIYSEEKTKTNSDSFKVIEKSDNEEEDYEEIEMESQYDLQFIQQDNDDDDDTQMPSTSRGKPSICRLPPLTKRSPQMKSAVQSRNRRKDISNNANNNERPTSPDARAMPLLINMKSDPEKLDLIHCSLCPRVFSQNSSLNIHMKRIHGQENKEHICHLCGKKYSWRSGLYKHMKTHHNS